MTAWTDNIVYIDHLEVLFHIEKKTDILITIEVKSFFLVLYFKKKPWMDHLSQQMWPVAAVLSVRVCVCVCKIYWKLLLWMTFMLHVFS